MCISTLQADLEFEQARKKAQRQADDWLYEKSGFGWKLKGSRRNDPEFTLAPHPRKRYWWEFPCLRIRGYRVGGKDESGHHRSVRFPRIHLWLDRNKPGYLHIELTCMPDELLACVQWLVTWRGHQLDSSRSPVSSQTPVPLGYGSGLVWQHVPEPALTDRYFWSRAAIDLANRVQGNETIEDSGRDIGPKKEKQESQDLA